MKTVDLAHIKAVLFDLDGVLIDSMPHHVRAWQTVLSEFGIFVPEERLRRHEGEKAKVTIGRIAGEHGLNFNDQELEELVEKKRKIYRQTAPRGMTPTARRAVDSLRERGYETAIVTGSVRPNLEWALSQEERDLFNAIITSEVYSNGKPHPEPYLKAANILTLEAKDCLVIENAPLGIQSAKAAGMTCIALTTTLPAEELSEADQIIPDLRSLADLMPRRSD